MKLSPQSQFVLCYLMAHGPRSLIQLTGVVFEPISDLHVRLKNMRSLGYLHRDTSGDTVMFSALAEADRPKVVRPERAARPEPEAQQQVVKSPQYDIMRAPVWQPPKSQPYRAGALDFKACPSMEMGRTLEVNHG
jgi:hypothetical protein